MNRKGGTHLSKQDRNVIRDGLAINLTLKEITTSLDKDERTISKEIKKRRNTEEVSLLTLLRLKTFMKMEKRFVTFFIVILILLIKRVRLKRITSSFVMSFQKEHL